MIINKYILSFWLNKNFQEVSSMIHIFDGATGTMLQKSVLKPGMCPELLNIEAPEAIQNEIGRAHV